MAGRRLLLFVLLTVCLVASHSHGHGESHAGHRHEEEDALHSDKISASQPETPALSSDSFDLSAYIDLAPLKAYSQEVGVEVSAYVSTAALSLSAFFVFAALGLLKKITAIKGCFLNTLIAFAAGSLLGDVFLHVIPETNGSAESQSLIILGVFLFYLFDKLLSDPHEHREKGKPHSDQSVFLYLLADAMHNFLDGMAVAIAFRTGTMVGITTSFAILFHELPHELADFVVLMKSGRSLWRSLALQFLTGIAAMAGTWVALKDFSKENVERYALPLIIGNFLYLAMTSMLGELKANKSLCSLLGESLGFLTGVLLMFKLTLIE